MSEIPTTTISVSSGRLIVHEFRLAKHKLPRRLKSRRQNLRSERWSSVIFVRLVTVFYGCPACGARVHNFSYTRVFERVEPDATPSRERVEHASSTDGMHGELLACFTRSLFLSHPYPTLADSRGAKAMIACSARNEETCDRSSAWQTNPWF